MIENLSAGAIMAIGGSNLAILNSTFAHNVGLDAGAVGLRNSSLFVNGSTFANSKGQQVDLLHLNYSSIDVSC